MTYDQICSEVQIKTEQQKIKRDLSLIDKEMEYDPFEDLGKIVSVSQDKEDHEFTFLTFESINQKTRSFRTNNSIKFYEDLAFKEVYISGLMSKEEIPTLFVSCCCLIENEATILNLYGRISEEEMQKFLMKIKSLPQNIQDDLTKKYIHVSGMKNNQIKESNHVPLYIELTELEALYDVLEKIIPYQYRMQYQYCLQMMKTDISKTEHTNYMKVIYNILNIEWTNYYYQQINVDQVINNLKSEHIGHESQIETLRTILSISNKKQKAPRTIHFIGKSCGCKSLAATLAKSLGKKYAEIDLTGRRESESVELCGNTRIYENAQCGLLYEKIMDVGLNGVLIFNNIDNYSSDYLNQLMPFINKTIFTDSFMRIPMDLSDLWIICTSSSTKKIPNDMRTNTIELTFEELTEQQYIEVINKIILPRKCYEFDISYNEIPENICRTLIYPLSHKNTSKIEINIEKIIMKTIEEKKQSFPLLTEDLLIKYFNYRDNSNYYRSKYVNEFEELEKKFYSNYFHYPDSVLKRVQYLLQLKYNEDTEKDSEYINKALTRLINPTLGTTNEIDIKTLKTNFMSLRYGQEYLIDQICLALLSEKMTKTDNRRMMVFGLYGAPGTGKTSTPEIIAKILSRNYIKISLGGANDPSIVKGINKIHRNADTSRIMKELSKKSGKYNDVINFDEFDKCSNECFEAFLELLDFYEEYYDEYLECNIPKKDFLVFLSFNDISKIPLPILDRIHLIEIKNYSIDDKKIIIERYLLEHYQKQYGLDSLTISKDALDLLVNKYSISPGVRDAEKDIESIILNINKFGFHKRICITCNDVYQSLGDIRSSALNDKGNKNPVPGQAMALSISNFNGSCIAIQVVQDDYQLEPIRYSTMIENSCIDSLNIALSLTRRITKRKLPKLYIHCCMPDARKNGPSGGLAFFMAIMSCVLNKDLGNCAFTGTIDAFGNVGKVQVYEKLINAEREKIEKVYIPLDNYIEMKNNHLLEKFTIEIIPVNNAKDLIYEFFKMEAI